MLGDINDGQHSNTANVLTEQPRYLVGDSRGGVDNGLYTAHTLQEYRDTRDVYYTHVHQDLRESLDHVLVSEQFYDHSRNGCGCLMVSSSTTTISTSTTTARLAPATMAWSKSASHSSPRAPDDAFRLPRFSQSDCLRCVFQRESQVSVLGRTRKTWATGKHLVIVGTYQV
ncbi:hypothetical protein ACW9HQ_30915 [Nocardia gipuzkoensis]